MHIKKLSHCCLIIDLKTKSGDNRRILLDPGSYSIEEHSKVKDSDIILITHEHSDHFHIESLKTLLKHTPDSTVITNDVVGEMLAKEGITHQMMKHGDSIEAKGVRVEAFGKVHAIMHSSIPPVSNIGYFIENKFFFPGDAFTDPLKPVDVLALPVSGPWMKISEAVDYALQVKPRIAIPVHDGLRFGSAHAIPERVLANTGIQFIKLEEGGELDI
jgi:L-ascorbate metabolism protein UlaG (beta-lactamase superfamily)